MKLVVITQETLAARISRRIGFPAVTTLISAHLGEAVKIIRAQEGQDQSEYTLRDVY